MEEQWAEIKDFEDYFISSKGRVKSFKRDKENGKIMSFGSSGKYYTVVLRKNNKIYNKYIHRLVAETFIPNEKQLPQVNHIDEDTHNNCVENLEWITQKDNNNYGTRLKRANSNRSENIPHYRPVKCIELNKIFPSISAAAREMNVRDSSIRKACIGKSQTCKQFHWEFV